MKNATFIAAALAALLANSVAYAQIGASQNHKSDSSKISAQSGSTLKTDSSVTVTGGSEFKQEGGSTIEFKDGAPVQQTGSSPTFHDSEFKQEGSGVTVESGSTLKLSPSDGRPMPAATAKSNGKAVSKLPPSDGNSVKPNTTTTMSEGGLEMSKAKCAAACKEKYKSSSPLNSAIENSTKSPADFGGINVSPEEKAAKQKVKEQKEKEVAENEAKYQSCLAQCPQ